MFKNKSDKEKKEKCLEKIRDTEQKQRNLGQRLYETNKIINNRSLFKTEGHRAAEIHNSLVPLEKKWDKYQFDICKQRKEIKRIEDSKYCLEERKQQEALKNQEIEKLSHVKMNEPSIYHDGTFGEVWTGKKISRQWNESMKSNSNDQPGCSHWDRRANQTPFTSPFGKI